MIAPVPELIFYLRGSVFCCRQRFFDLDYMVVPAEQELLRIGKQGSATLSSFRTKQLNGCQQLRHSNLPPIKNLQSFPLDGMASRGQHYTGVCSVSGAAI
jgi:hypothetical protein